MEGDRSVRKVKIRLFPFGGILMMCPIILSSIFAALDFQPGMLREEHLHLRGLELPENEYGRGDLPRPYSFFGEIIIGTVGRYENNTPPGKKWFPKKWATGDQEIEEEQVEVRMRLVSIWIT
jgi:hypothetical protein